jgi:hypothetical protein
MKNPLGHSSDRMVYGPMVAHLAHGVQGNRVPGVCANNVWLLICIKHRAVAACSFVHTP